MALAPLMGQSVTRAAGRLTRPPQQPLADHTHFHSSQTLLFSPTNAFLFPLSLRPDYNHFRDDWTPEELGLGSRSTDVLLPFPFLSLVSSRLP